MRIKNWDRFQHFKDRRPPWIKLYKDILEDDEWFDLSPTSAKVLIQLWLLASEDETGQGLLPSVKKMMFRLRLSEKALETACSELSHFLIHDDINLISDRHHGDIKTETTCSSETETETETDTQKHVDITLEQIREQWNAIQGVKPCKQITGTLKTKINRLVKAHPPEWWSGFFHEIKSSSFLTGKTPPRDGKRPFRIDIDWATGPINISKILSGKYVDDASSRPTKVVL